MKTLGLYIHIPYCSKKCNYCDFFSIKPDSKNTLSEYVTMLCNNLKSWREKLKDYTIDTIYFGGGTPSLLATSDIITLLESIYYNFNVSKNPEITIEGNPNSIIALDLGSLKKSGLNRISMGLQSINDEELKLLGRLHSSADVRRAINEIKKSSIDNFSLDVMLGIPLQNTSSLKETLDFCINSDAKHISTYMLKIEENTPFFLNKENLSFADNDTMADLYELTCHTLIENGYRHYEISNFCKDNLVSKHNMKYWNLDDYLGIGPSAHSLINGKRFYYPRDFESFASNSYLYESEGNTPEEYIMLSLRTDLGLSFSEYEKKSSTKINTSFLRKCETFQKAGLLNMSNDVVVLTEKGYLVSNAIISELIELLL